MDNLFRLMERFVDLKLSRERQDRKEFLQKAMFIPFLFCPSEFMDLSRIGTFIEFIDWYSIFTLRTTYNYYRGHHRKYCKELYFEFLDSYQPEPSKTLDDKFIHLFGLY